MLPGIILRSLKRLPDDRGSFMEAMREDWQDLLGEDRLVQANVSRSFPGMVRAWHRHSRGQVDYYLVLNGSLKICAYDDDAGSPTRGELVEVIASGDVPQIVRMPGHYWHGTKCVSPDSALLLYFVTHLYDYESPDEERRPWNDPAILDPHTGEPYDWLRPPHR